jgi:hypothetical protein
MATLRTSATVTMHRFMIYTAVIQLASATMETSPGSAFTRSLDHAGAVDAISQSIVLGANVQLNNVTFTDHDSIVADHCSTRPINTTSFTVLRTARETARVPIFRRRPF